MRLFEFTNAQEQLALLRIIFDNTFASINQQAEDQAKAKAEKNRQAKLKPKHSSSLKPKALPSIKAPPPIKTPRKLPIPSNVVAQPPKNVGLPPNGLASTPNQPPPIIPANLSSNTTPQRSIQPIKPLSTIKPIAITTKIIKPKSKNSKENDDRLDSRNGS
jgi:hypothetical protein